MEKFTIIITHYNQMDYIKTSINSVLSQTYKNIELIIADDCSKQFNKKIVKDLIENKNKKHFEYKIIQGKKNVGTVKNLNNALKEVTGDFVLFFAADDRLSNNKVVENFIQEFKDQKKNIITSQCLIYDEKLKHKYCDYVDSKKALKLNKKDSKKIYEKMCEGCFYGAGGTAYRKIVFEKYGVFNENYKYVEDWAYWVYILRKGEKMYYADFNTLDHRDGGISHSIYTRETLPPHVKQYYIDILNIYENEVIPYIHIFSTKEKYKILRKYNDTIISYLGYVPELLPYLKRLDNVRISDKKLKYYWKIKTLKRIFLTNNYYKLMYYVRYRKAMLATILFWIISCYCINILNIKNNNILLTIYILLYLVEYILISSIRNILFIIKNRKKEEKNV